MANIRLDKFLADMGCGTRTEVKAYIKKGRVSVNGDICKSPETKIDNISDSVSLDGSLVGYVEFEYYMLNKPQGVISATNDKKTKTVVDIIETKNRKDLFPVGRLDKDTEGLLLITNDGMLAHNLLSPKKHVDKIYYAEIDGIVSADMINEFKNGFKVDEDFIALPSELIVLENDGLFHESIVEDKTPKTKIQITICEGKFHQIKRMFETFGMTVTYLKRLQMGSLVLDDSLMPGEYRQLTPKEISDLQR